MHITVGFDSGLIDDRSYPPLQVGQTVNLSFQVELTSPLEKTGESIDFQVAADAECVFVADVLRIYRLPTEQPLGIVQAGDFRFYIEGNDIIEFKVGDRISGAGSLVVDYYIWVEFLDKYEDAPSLFYKMKVERLRKISIRSLASMIHWRRASFSERLRGERYADAQIEDVASMNEHGSEYRLYLVNLDDRNVIEADVPKTFLGGSATQHGLGPDAKKARRKP